MLGFVLLSYHVLHGICSAATSFYSPYGLGPFSPTWSWDSCFKRQLRENKSTLPVLKFFNLLAWDGEKLQDAFYSTLPLTSDDVKYVCHKSYGISDSLIPTCEEYSEMNESVCSALVPVCTAK